ncbi:hydantoinase/oxoprolinase family protein [Pseudooceanicola sp. GBMRC 2024]|uniref:Hydantoinase/oxoprolinase family protein n=1 Tax=Pseudooceanicola albus TaxID=2692189 RepID=A0A6L7G306_9RHOB|nr:hydantoinase/oxoprolinase family protein [Pseudooceanicola albus]MXN17888.1 hydantoinase/oxoprolinase family protein [Pseudooceanicola albus]
MSAPIDMSKTSLRLSADVGGTFTDVVLEEGPQRWTTKVLTTPAAPEEGVLNGIAKIMGIADRSLPQVDVFVHGTTLATNAIIERRGALTALIGTDGFRDILEIGTESRYDQYELALVRPAPLVDRPLRHTLRGRMDARGNELAPLDEAQLAGIAQALTAQGVTSVAVALMHSYMNPAHEKRVREILTDTNPGLYVSLSCEVCPEIREYERTSTTVANAYVKPLMDGYLGRMETRLQELGFAGILSLITSGGGLTSVATAREFPVRLVESGPAGGAVFAAQIAARLGESQVIAFDMGGTTAKVSLIEGYASETSRVFEVDRAARFLKGSGLPLRIPVIEMVEIGAGGGSLARIDALKRVTVGPESASSVPGPACYGGGGTHPAVTDADVTLGLIDPQGFAGGSMRLRDDLSKAALSEHVGNAIGLSSEMAAYAVYEMVCENMASAARAHTVETGMVASDHTIIATGGAAPLHVARVAEKIGAPRVIVPANAGVGSAVGFLAAPVSYEIVRSQYMRLDAFDAPAATAMLNEVAAEIRAWVEPAAHGQQVLETSTAYMRYVGQGHEIPVILPNRDLTEADIATMRAAYEATYEEMFNRSIPAAAIEIMAWSVACSTPPVHPEAIEAVEDSGRDLDFETATIFDGRAEAFIEVPRYHREALIPGDRLSGPAIIVENETTTFVTASFDVHVDAAGSIVMDRKDLAEQELAA